MSSPSIPEQIRFLRKSKGLSQEALAENAGINLRTLQRIETGDTTPRGETLRMLANALDTTIEELSESGKEDKGFLKLMNLSVLSFWFIPLGNVFIPLLFWIFRKDVIKGVGELGKRILNFQITWSLITYGFMLTAMSSVFYGRIIIDPFSTMIILGLLYFFNTIFVIITTIKLSRGEENVYAYSLRIIR